jgi:hypothetical protein
MNASTLLRLRSPRVPLIAMLGGLLLIGCARKHHDAAATPPLPETIPLEVTNHNFLDVAIYAVCEGQRTRIGMADGSSSTLMGIPWRLLGPDRDMQLVGDAIGSPERAITEVIFVQPGQVIKWVLETGLSRSSVGVY